MTELPSAGAVREQMTARAETADLRQTPSPLTDELGQHRILRTSPLTEVPFVC
jgi:hypothetical protein